MFLEEMKVDALGVCNGNVHGKYPASGPKLDLKLLKVQLTIQCGPHCNEPETSYV
jgi:fructose/tagatose bisphosphate aldolase